MPKHRFRVLPTVTACLFIAGCSSLPDATRFDQRVSDLQPTAVRQDSVARVQHWAADFNDPTLTSLIEQGISDNFTLQQARYQVEAAWQSRKASRATLIPQFNLGADASRSRNNRPDVTYGNTYQVSATIAWELDLWGKNLSTFQAQDLLFEAEKASYESARLSLAAQIARAWYQSISDQLLQELLTQRVSNLSSNLDIIQNGYRQGINSALDVYLARSDLSTEQSNLSAQQESLRDSTRQLQLLLGDYPSAELADISLTSATLPVLPGLNADLKTDSVLSRYDVLSAYLQMAAADRQLAAAHRARFPSLTITAHSGDSADQSSQLFDGRSLSWSIIGGITAPLFTAGRLAAQQDEAAARLKQAEQQYLASVNLAFSEIEQALSNQQALTQQLTHQQQASRDAESALELAFSQYRRGLTNYSDVLEAQRRAFSARSNTINLRNLLLQNRINLYLAAGADYGAAL